MITNSFPLSFVTKTKTFLLVICTLCFFTIFSAFSSLSNTPDAKNPNISNLQSSISLSEKVYVAYQLADCEDEPTLKEAYLSSQAREQSTKAATAMMADVMECQRISSCDRDAEQYTNGGNLQICGDPGLTDLDLGLQAGNANNVAMNWGGWTIPPGSTITSAYIQFTALSNSIGPAAFSIVGEAADNSSVFSNANDIVSRTGTAASVNWSPGTWTAGDAGNAQKTPDLSAIIQEIVNRPGYAMGNNITIGIVGRGKRQAYDFENGAAQAPQLCITYVVPDPPTSTCNGCPDISVVSLDGVPNFPTIDLLNVCSVPDTGSLLIYNSGECMLRDVELTITFDEGLSYGGFVFMDMNSIGTGTVAPSDLSDLTVPSFTISQIDSAQAFIINFAVQADCDVDIESEEDINFDAEVTFTYDDDNGSTPSCTEVITEVGAYNSGIRVPVLNVLTVSPSDLNISQSNTPQCQRVLISQDGIQAFLDGFQFEIMGVDQDVYQITSIDISDVPVPAADYSYDPVSQTVSLFVTSDYFINDTSANNVDSDELFETNETIFIDVCYQVMGCTDEANFLMYNAFYGCNNKICGDVSQMQGAVDFTPNFGATAVVVSGSVQYGAICGADLAYDLVVQSSNSNPLDGLWEDLIFKYKGCIINNTTLVSLQINGATVPTDLWTAENGTVTIDLTTNTTDFDGAGGLTDEDGDGFFDDLPGGNVVTISTVLDIGCAMEGNDCGALSCSLSQLEVNGRRNCGQDFQQFATIGGEGPINFFYGNQGSEVTEIEIFGNVTLATEDFYPTCDVWSPTDNGYEFSYEFGSNNIDPCPSGGDNIELVVTVQASGAQRMRDLRYSPGTATYEGAAVAGVTGTYLTSPTAGGGLDTFAYEIRIPAGDSALDGVQSHDYYFNLDYMGNCAPQDWVYVSYKVVETCDACGDTDPCEVVRACDDTRTYVRWNRCSCECDLFAFIDTLYRTNYGFADKAMTMPLTAEDVPAVDRQRFLPGDTMYYRAGFEIRNQDPFIDNTFEHRQWQFFVNPREEAGPVMMDVYNSTFAGWFYEDAATGTITEIGVPDCMLNYPDATREGYYFPSMEIRNMGVEGKSTSWIDRNDDAYQTCIFDDNVNPNYPPESAVNYKMTDDDGVNDNRTDRQRIIVYWGEELGCEDTGANTDGLNSDASSNTCWEEFIAQYPMNEGDIIYFDVYTPMVHNPAFDLQQLNGTSYGSSGFLEPWGRVTLQGENCSTFAGINQCNQTRGYEGHLPGPMTVAPDVEVTDCDVAVEYTFTLSNPLPEVNLANGEVPWYENEYRPYMATEYLEMNFPTNMVYGDNGILILPSGDEVPLPSQYIDQTMGNLACITDPSGGLCCTAADTNSLAAIRFVDQDYTRGLSILSASENEIQALPGTSTDLCDSQPLVHVNMDPFPHIPVGGADPCLSYGLKYNLTSLCPEDVESGDFQLEYQFSEPYIPNLVGRSGGTYRGSFTTNGVEYSNSYRNLFEINPFGTRCGEQGIDDGCIAFYDRIFPHPVGSTGESNPMRQTGTQVTNPDQFIDNSQDFPKLIPMLQNLLKADLAGENETNVYTVCAGDMDAVGATHENVVTSIEVPNAVQLIDVQDDMGTALTWTLSQTLADSKVYAVSLPDLAPTECVGITIVTELLFCPVGLDVDTEICVSTVSGCLDAVKAAALSAAGGSCDEVSACYQYVAEEADLQVEWLLPDPTNPVEYGLCEQIPMSTRIKNVKPAVLTAITQDYFFPTGLTPISGSWEVCYPGGPNFTGPCMTIPAADEPQPISSENNIFGMNYSWDEDADWSMFIDQSGLPGILSSDGSPITLDSNFVEIRFMVETECDDFVSGTGVYFQSFGADPCEATVQSMFVESEPIIIENANPADFAQFFVFAEPAQANCGEDASLVLTYLNVSPLGESRESTVCIDLETDAFNYMTGSVKWLAPSTHTPTITEEMNGPITHVCFDIPDGIGPGEAFQISIDFSIPEDIDCGAQDLGVAVSSEIMDQTCDALGIECSVYVLNSINPQIEIDFLPPLNVDDQTLMTKCPNDDGTVDLCYDITFSNPGDFYSGDVTLKLIRDVNLNGIIDDPIIDTELEEMTQLLLVNTGETATLTGCFTVQNSEACPVFLMVTQTTDCVCDNLDFYFDSIEPAINDDMQTEYTLCPGIPFGIENCGSWTYSVTPSNGANITQTANNDSLYITLNAGFGDPAPVILTVTSQTGGCQSFDFPIQLYSLADFEFGPFAGINACNVGCQELNLNIPADYENSVTVEWLPNQYLDDNTSLTPTICDPQGDINYFVKLTFMSDLGSCEFTANYPVTVEDETTEESMEDANLCSTEQATLEAPTGFSNYDFIKINTDGSETTVASGPENTFIATEEGQYYVKYRNLGATCAIRSNNFVVSSCPELTKTITTIVPTTNPNEYIVSYDIEVENTGTIPTTYDLYDIPGFDTDIVASAASFTTDAAGVSGSGLTLPAPAAPGWLLGDDVSLPGTTIHTYTISYTVTIDLTDGVTGDDMYTSCGQGSGPANAGPGEGLYNSASLDLDNDPTTEELQDDDCGELPYLGLEKEHTSTVETSLNCYDVTYVIKVTNTGGADGQYDLVDDPEFDDDFTIESAIFTTDAIGNPGGSLPTTSSTYVLANDQIIAPGKVDSFEIVIGVCLDLEDATTVGDETYTACGAGTPGDPTSGEGLFNEARLDVNNDGTPDIMDEDCDDVPYFTLEKTQSMAMLQADGTYNIVYTITVNNIGGAEGTYNLNDLPGFDDDIVILSASFTSDVPSSGTLPAMVPAGGWVLAEDETIPAFDTDIYTLTVNVDYDFFDGTTGDDEYTECGQGGTTPGSTGEGLFNEALLDTNDDGVTDIIDEECQDLESVDVALTKVVNTPGPYTYGTVVNFDIEVYNQGTVTLTEIEVIDYPGCGYSYVGGSATTWTPSGDNYVATIAGPLAPGETTTISINYEVVACTSNTENAYLNIAEVASMDDEDGNDVSDDDVDSMPDTDPTNDPGGSVDTDSDDVVDGDGTGTPGDEVPGTDEDDQDPAQIEIFDLALQKQLTTTPPFNFGDMVVFTVTVFNQGNVPATQVEVSDYIPVGFSYDQTAALNMTNGWGAGPNPSTTIAGPIMPGMSASVQIELEFMTTGGGEEDWWNYAEISNALDGDGNPTTDIDSTPDSDPNNDNDVQPGDPDDNNIDGDATQGEDEDDHDPADIFTVVDIALAKTLSTPPPYTYGQVLTYSIEVTNQGNMDLQNIVITDYVPCGLSYVGGSPAWSLATNGQDYETTIQGPLMAGTSTTITIDLEVVACTSTTENAWLNYAEISYMEDDMGNDVSDDDVDSNADNNPNNDVGGTPNSDEDDHVDDDGMDSDGDGITDEDDHDPVLIEIFDLALTKVLDTAGPYNYGDELTFTIEVTNQGNVTATDILVTDYIPSGYVYVSGTPEWTANGDNYETTIAGPLAAGTSMTVEIVLEVVFDNTDGTESYINVAEISSALDGEGNPVTDIDSTPDAIEENDAGGDEGTASDDVIDGDGTGDPLDDNPVTDEDDQDPAGIQIVDVALTKVVNTPGPYSYGDVINFDIEVFNQGSVTLTEIDVIDYPSCGYSYVGGSATTWLPSGPNYVATIPGPIVPGGSVTISINYEVIPCTSDTENAYLNVAEVYGMEDAEGNDVSGDDVDSTPDQTEGNDPGGSVDTDSDNVVEGDGTGTPGDEVPGTDEDDQDPAQIEVFDLALTKVLDTPAPYAYGDELTFTIEVTNQGNVTATDILVTDYIPSGYTYVSGTPAWTASGDNYETTIAGPLAAGTSTTVEIVLELIADNADGDDSWINVSEISSAADGDGNPVEDIDSTPDATEENDAGGEIDTGSDDVIDGDASGDPGDEDPLTDEDDQDPAGIFVVDVALAKTTLSEGPYTWGDPVEFNIEVINQGSVTLTDIEVTDYIPCGFTYLSSNDGLWSYDAGTGNAVTVLAGPIAPQGTMNVQITLELTMCDAPADAWTNVAEVSEMFDDEGTDVTEEDIDSEADDTEGNDAGGNPDGNSDDSVDGDGTGNPGDDDPATDEDDSDPEFVEVFDLALTKTIGSEGPYEWLEDITYDVNIFNQGNEFADNILITDYFPSCFALNDTDWTDNGDSTAEIMLSVANGGLGAPLAPGASITVPITLTVGVCSTQEQINYAEISSATDEEGNVEDDVDSTPDDTNGNDAGGEEDTASDDVVDGDGTGVPGDEEPTTDEDDHDPEDVLVVVPVWDLALVKALSLEQPNPVEIGDAVSFDIQVTNQGTEPADNITVTDYLPTCMTLTDGDWTDNGDGTAEILLSVANGGLVGGPLAPGQSVLVDITFTVDACATGTIMNWAEISDFTDEYGDPQDDDDSTPDDDQGNDIFDGDDNIDDNGMEGGDEDDHDPADVTIIDPVSMTFDLALTKTLTSGQAGPFGNGATVTFDINLENQGNIAADNIEVIDYLPSCFVLTDPDWTDNGDGTASILLSVANGLLSTPLQPGMDIVQTITVTLSNCPAGDIVNYAEITDATDENGDPVTDIDSTPDDTNGNDAGGNPDGNSDDVNDGDGSGTPGDDNPNTDEDDHDPEVIQVDPDAPMDFDLALTKILTPGQAMPVANGDLVSFQITVYNQGDVAADNIEVTDYMPSCMSLSDTDWTDNGDGTAVIMLSVANGGLATPLLPGADVMVEITLSVDSCNNGTETNWAEISDVTDGAGNPVTDIDSTPDDTNDDPFQTDNDTSGDGTDDEDDHDPADIPIENPVLDTFDLALTKMLDMNQVVPVTTGDLLTFNITVYNQGNVSADNIELVDYLPSCFTLSDGNWAAGAANTATRTLSVANGDLVAPLAPGQNVEVPISVVVGDCGAAGTITNYAEITGATDEDGDPVEDIDSDPDDNPDNDGPPVDDATNDPNDEDDHDPADVPFIPVDEPMETFDLALNKTLAPGQANPVTPGSSVTYNVMVVNQGDVLADNIELVDYLPSCATLNDADWTAAAGNTATITLSVANGGLTAPLDTGDSVIVPITVTMGSSCSGTVVNYAEISGATDENGDPVTDVDSTPDDTNGNDAGGNPDGNSDDVLMGDGSGVPGDDVPGTDEDDHDPETIEVTPAAPDDFDLALTKVLSSAQVVPVQNGDLVVFEIEVTNQGDVAADNIEVVDYIPTCMTLSDPNWTSAGSSTAVTTLSVANGGLTTPLQPAQSVTVFITLEVVNCANGDVVNYAEISGATDGNGDPVTDVDSNPDNNNGNDAGGNPDGNSDDVIDGDGAGNPGDDNPSTDEDDHDPAVVPVDNTVPNPDDFDLALIKELSATQTVPVVEGDIVTFDITVFNQGDVSADNIEITDYIPSCLTLSDANWTAGAGNTATQLLSVANGGLNAPLAPSQSVTVSINLLAGACTPGTVTNYAEISDATDGSGDPVTDIDSTPDGTNGNDAGGNPDGNSDNVVNGDGEGTPGDDDPFTDEDDHDPATFPFEEEVMPDPEFDLALVKTLAPGQANPAQPGSVTFQVTVFNQGEVIADNIEVTDYMPSCATLNDPNWTDNGDGTAVRTLSVANGGLSTPLAVDASVSVLITLDMSTCTGTVVNWAEISDATDGLGNPVDDVDSTPDDTQGNDTYTTDNGTSGDGMNGGDEDDHDPEEITINPNTPMDFDLALIKTLATFQTTPVANGDLVSFEITVFNQGDVAADNIEVVDYIPSCMILNDADWTDNGDGTATKTLSVANGELSSPLLPGAQTSVIVTLELVNCANGVEVNYAEISDATDGNGDPVVDVDSDPDNNPGNDGPPVDDATDDPNDEDDHDPAEIPVENPAEPGNFDLALIKVLAPGQSASVMTGDFVDYEIYVINQGDVPADNISVVDYIPSCFTLADPDWTNNGDGTASITISVANGFLPNALLPNTSVAIPITLQVGSCSGTSQTNWAEITDATDNEGNPVDDIDSTPDDTDGNDPFGEDDQTDGNGTDDEDDNDPETVDVQDELEDEFDLALTKTLPFGQSGTVPTNSVVTFDINVFNQGTIAADNIEIVDYLPSCATLQDPNWTDNGDGTASRTISVANGDMILALAPGQQITVQITMDFAGCAVGSHTNWAEISDATDNMGNPVSDVDSTPDDTQGNDNYGDDNQTNGDGVDDEDDHDPETIMISPIVDPEFDLALIKTLADGQSSNVANGNIVVFDITVFNQGNVAADDIEVIDYLPSCFTLVDPNWFYDASTHTAVRVISVVGGDLVAPLGPGQSITVPVSVQLNGCPLGSIVNWAEIEEATDGNGDPVTDIDSTADDDQENDVYGEDDQIDGDGTDDEDDHDQEMVQVMNPVEVPDDFDLALIKILAPGQLNEVQEGDFIKFRIQVTNQGDVAADNIEVVDYFPACTSLADSGWTDNGNSSASTMLSVANGALLSPLTPGQSTYVDINLLVGDCVAGDQFNWAEISGATDGAGDPVEDIDSTPDDNQGNDTYTTDNETDEDGMNGGDEDDHDPELFIITPIFDLALTKTVTSSGPYSFGDNVDFAITVYNQGNVPADNIEITDYVPAGYVFNASDNIGWTDNGDGTLTYLETTLLGVNSSRVIPLTLELVQTSGGSSNWINYSEISDATDEEGNPQEDVDSQMDDFPDNDNDVVPGDENDDVIDEDPGEPGEDDEDDHDPAGIDVFDLAQIKTTNDEGPFSYGDEVAFTMTVYNQGNVPASNVVVNDYIPCGYEYLASNDGTWTYDSGTGIATTTLTGVINPGASAFVEITLEVQECYVDVANAWTNVSEIESATDDEGNPQDDTDSTPDDDPTNDGDPEDDEVDGDPSDPENPDEDDHDPETIEVFDLALQKQLVTGAPYSYGQVLEFKFNVINQGNVDAYNVELTDYMPSGYVFDPGLNIGWTQVGGDLVYNVPFVAAASTEVVSLYLELYETGDGEADYYNGSEISDADDNENPNDEDPDDADSDPDDDPDNDNPVTPGDDNDDEVNDTPNDPQGPNDDDEDDSDPAAPEFFDLAIVKKVVEAGPYVYGDVITYTFDIYNQGTIDAYDIGLVDYLPCGLIYMSSNDASGWSYNSATGMVTRTVGGPLLAGEVTQVTMTAQIQYCEESGAWYNAVEITGADDENGVPQDDIDSDPDNDPTNDGDPTDDNINNDNGDEDDHDPMEIDIFDLAYTKRSTYQGVDSIGPFVPGDIVDFAMTVHNQGNVDAYNVQITDYLNHGYIFNNELNPGWTLTSDGLVQTIIPGPIAVGSTYEFVLQLEVVVPDDAELGDWYNEGEISAGDNEEGSPQTDSDSTPDEDPDNDNDLVDGDDDDPIFNGDDNDNVIDEDINDPFGNGDDDEDDNDAAEVLTTGELGDTVWKDLDGDGIQDPNEPGVAGVVVTLSDCDGNVLETMVTDADGFYLFDLLLPGEYQINFDISGLPEGCDFTYQNQGGDDAADSDVDLSGTTECIDLMAGERDSTWDAGLLILASLGDYVWHDLDGDGQQDLGEPGLEGVQVNLYDGDGNLVGTMFTDANGYYLFDLLYPGDYYVEFFTPDGFELTFANTGVNDATDSDVDNSNGFGTTQTTTLDPGENDFDWDAGYYMCVPIGELVWYDTNENDIADTVENGINGLVVQLWKFHFGQWVIWEVMNTGHKPGTPSDDGYYKFCAPPGTYYIEVQLPPFGLVPVVANVGNNDLIDSDVTNANGVGTTDNFTVYSGEEKCDLGHGYYPQAMVGDRAWRDDNENGLQDSNELPMENVKVQAINSTGDVVSEAYTESNGTYMLDYLGKDSYYLKFEAPSGFSFTSPNMGDDAMDSDVDNTNGYGTTDLYVLNPGDEIPNVDAGFKFGSVVPVEWLSFTGESRGSFHKLDWSTANEINASHFEVERRREGEQEYASIGQVAASGTTSEVSNYRFEDYDIYESGVYYYRLKQIDFDGRHDYSQEISLRVEGGTAELSLALYPNPTVDQVNVSFSLSERSRVKLSIWDADGQLVRADVISREFKAGEHEQALDISKLTSGVYTVKLKVGETISYKKLIVLQN